MRWRTTHRAGIAATCALGALVLASCSATSNDRAPAAATAPATPPAPTVTARDAVAIANRLLDQLLGDLKARLTDAMNGGGPAAAIEVCASDAQRITAAVPEIAAAGLDAKVGRSSLRLRNPANRAPDWVQRWLDVQGERPAEGVKGASAVVTLGGKRIARVLRPIPIQGMCLTCHGPTLMIPPDVQAVLKERYPADQATGYALGALRGVAWAEVHGD